MIDWQWWGMAMVAAVAGGFFGKATIDLLKEFLNAGKDDDQNN